MSEDNQNDFVNLIVNYHGRQYDLLVPLIKSNERDPNSVQEKIREYGYEAVRTISDWFFDEPTPMLIAMLDWNPFKMTYLQSLVYGMVQKKEGPVNRITLTWTKETLRFEAEYE